MIKIFTNVVTRKSYDANGDLFPDGLPRIFYNGSDEVRWQLCSATPDIASESGQKPEDVWPKCTDYADYQAIGAFLTADQDYIKRMPGTLTANVNSGAVASISANIPGASLATIPEEGTVTLFTTSGDMETIEYTERAIANENVQFTIASGTTLEHSYVQGGMMDVAQSVLMQATLDTVNSDVAHGLFAFNVTAYSRKLHDALAYANTKQLDVAGLELAIFNIDTENNEVVDLERFDIDTFSIRSGIADTSMDAQVTPGKESEAVTVMKTLLASGMELQFSADGETDWHSEQSTADESYDMYYHFRLAGSGGAWSVPIKLPDGSAQNAKVWAEGTDQQVALLGGLHSAKVWAALVAQSAAYIVPPQCSDMGIVIGTTSIAITWGDPANLVVNGWTLSEWQRTVAVVKIGSHPNSIEDGIIIAATSRDPENDDFELPAGVSFGYKDAYKSASITVQVEDGDTVCVKLFSCSRSGSWNSMAANEYPSHTVYSWGQLAEYADAGTFLSHVPIGSTLDMEHADFPGHQWEVMDMDGFVPKNPAQGHHVNLVSRYVLFSVACDAAETTWELTTDTAAVTGVKYGLNINGTMTSITEGTDWTAGDTSVTKDGVTYPISDWYERNPNTSQGNGTNFTPQRNDVQWMNTDGKANEWFHKQNKWDSCTASLAARNGFLRNLPSVFKDNMIECTRTAYVYTVYRIRGVGASITFDSKCFPLNLYEIFGTVVENITEGKKRLAFFADGGSAIAYTKEGTAAAWWSASAFSGSAIYVYYVSAAGASTISYATGAIGYRPACAFGKPVSQNATTP